MLLGVLLTGAVLALVPHPTMAQSNAAEPQPGPEHKRLEYLIGKWKVEDVAKPSAVDPGGRTTGTTTCEWFDGRFQVICRSDLTLPTGRFKQLEIFAYSASESGYTRYFIGSAGEAAFTQGKVNGKTWAWPTEFKADGKLLRIDTRVTEVSPDSWTSKVILTIDGGAPTTVGEGTATRIK